MLAEFVVRIIPAKAGIQNRSVTARFRAMDFRFRENDSVMTCVEDWPEVLGQDRLFISNPVPRMSVEVKPH